MMALLMMVGAAVAVFAVLVVYGRRLEKRPERTRIGEALKERFEAETERHVQGVVEEVFTRGFEAGMAKARGEDQEAREPAGRQREQSTPFGIGVGT